MNERTTSGLIPAATIILGRDRSDDLEIFMVQRNRQIDFAAGALVFPGGRVEADDASPGVCRRCAPIAQGREPDIGFYVAAIREVYEECGILLARDRDDATIVSAARLAGLEDKRRAICDKTLTFSELLEAENLYPACDCLTPFSHWVTPEFMPKRFDTWFFIAAAPEGHTGCHDGCESVDSLWLTPKDALAGAGNGTFKVIFPTRMNIAKMGRFNNLEQARAYCASTPVVRVLPRLAQGPDGPVLRIPAEADYGLTEESISKLSS